MNAETLESFVRQYIQAQEVPEVVFAWQGGEPTLMGLDFFKMAVTLQKKYRKPGMRIQNSFQTNGILVDDDWCQFFHDENFLIGISLDGPEPYHDAYRQDKGGKPTFSRVVSAIERMKRHRVDFNILACVQAANAPHPIEVYRFFRDEIGAQFIQFIPIVERLNQTGFQEGNQVTHRSVTGRQYGSFLTSIFDEWVRKDVGKTYVQLFDSCLAAWSGYPAGLCVYEKTCGLAMALEHNGDLYSCDHFVQPDCFLGNILQTPIINLVNSAQQRKFGQDKDDTLPRYCRECPVRFICNGECPKNRFIQTPDGEDGLNYLCAGLKAFFLHIDRPMRVMADLLRQRRPPAEIMRLLALEDVLRSANADDPCPCGSGKKVKQCHGRIREADAILPPPPNEQSKRRNRH